jgi:outer membrane protein assembly factor BamB
MKLALTMGLTAAVCAAAFAEDWPQFRGIRADAISREKGINKDWNKKPPKLLWKVPVGDDGYAGPAVAGGKVFYIDHSGKDDIVRAIKLTSGEEVWHYTYPDSDESKYGFARATPTIRDGKVYTFSRLGTLNCLDEKTGALVWTLNIVKDLKGSLPSDWDASASPVIDGKRLLIVSGGKEKPLAALDKDTGKVIWEGGARDAPTHSTPVVAKLDGKKQYIVLFGGKLQGIDPETGAGLWSYPWPSVNIPEPTVIGGNKVLITTSYQQKGSALIEVKNNVAKLLWDNPKMKCYLNTPVLIGGYLYGTTNEPPGLSCIQAETGKTMWKQPGFVDGGVVAVDGTLIVMNASNGDLAMVAVTSDGYKELGRIKGLGRNNSWTPPIVSGGKLIVRDTKNIACYDLK